MSKSRPNSKLEAYKKGLSDTYNLSKSSDNTIRFNFRYFIATDKNGQSFSDWQEDKVLADLNDKLVSFSSQDIQQLLESRELVEYGAFPKNSKFKEPKVFAGTNVRWARLRLTQNRRLIGVFIPGAGSDSRQLFYVVFLDKNHVFYQVDKNK